MCHGFQNPMLYELHVIVPALSTICERTSLGKPYIFVDHFAQLLSKIKDIILQTQESTVFCKTHPYNIQVGDKFCMYLNRQQLKKRQQHKPQPLHYGP